MDTADIVHLAGDHARAIRRDDPAQGWHWQIRAMFGQQPGRMQPSAPIAAVTGYLQHGQSCGHLAERDDTNGQNYILVTQ